MGGERRARLLAEARNDIERAGGKAGLARQIGERERGQAGLLGRLQHAGVAHRQRRADGAPADLHRVVPRHDMAGHAVRLAQRVDGVAVEIGDRLAHHLVGRPGVEFHVARHRDRVGAGLLERLADVERLDPRQVVDAGEDQIGKPRQQAAALGGGEPPHGPGERALRRFDRGVDVGAAAARDRADFDAARRILDRQARARSRLDPAPVDETFAGVEPGRHWLSSSRVPLSGAAPHLLDDFDHARELDPLIRLVEVVAVRGR